MKFKDIYGDLSDKVYDGSFDCSNNNLTSLEGCPKEINGYFYKDGEFVKVSDRIAPVIQEGKILSYNKDDVNFWKSVAEKHVNEFVKKDAPVVSDTTMNTVNTDDIPF